MNENNHPENTGESINQNSGTQKQTFRSGNFSPIITQRRSVSRPMTPQNTATAGNPSQPAGQRIAGQNSQPVRPNGSPVPQTNRNVRIPQRSAQPVKTQAGQIRQNPVRQTAPNPVRPDAAASHPAQPQTENRAQVIRTTSPSVPASQNHTVQQTVTTKPPVRQTAAASPDKTSAKKPKKTGHKRKSRIPTAVEYNQAQLRKMERAESASSALSSLVKAVIYIVAILVVSGFLSYFGISIGNDVFSLMKTGDPVDITITDGIQTSELSKLLKENGIIAYPTIFDLYASLRGGEKGYEFLGGTYSVSAENNYDELLSIFEGPKKTREIVTITIKEGSTVNDIITLFVDEYGMGTREGFVDAIQNYNFDYWFIPDPSTFREGRTYRLEGYLYPDTYQFFTDWSEVAILYKILDNFNVKFDEKYQARCQEIGWSVDDVLTLASMIQMEGKLEQEYSTISSVFHNRLNNPTQTNGMLGSDATIQYVLTERHEDLTQEELDLDNPYNTYLYRGLPPGPISNPTYLEIIAAIFPKETNYYYFISEASGKTLFAETYEEHLKNKALVKSVQ